MSVAPLVVAVQGVTHVAPECSLVVASAPGITQFVFGTDALVDGSGASALLDRFNQRDTARVLGEQPDPGPFERFARVPARARAAFRRTGAAR